MQTQTNDIVNNKTPVHIKAQHNDEFRRFSLADTSFDSLESLLRRLFNLSSSDIKVQFLDDENDWIVISSDPELQHAIEISTSPIRIRVTLVIAKTPVTSVPEETKGDAVSNQEQFCFRRRGCGKGMGGCNKNMLSKEEKRALKTTRIASRIQVLEAALQDPSLPSDRERALTWRLDHLKAKLERVKSGAEDVQEKPWRKGPGHCGLGGAGPCSEQEVGHVPCGDAPAWGHCGRRGGRCGRARFDVHHGGATEAEGDHVCGKKWVVPKEAWAHFHECKERLQAARRSGDAEAIRVAQEAFFLAKKEKMEARYSKA